MAGNYEGKSDFWRAGYHDALDSPDMITDGLNTALTAAAANYIFDNEEDYQDYAAGYLQGSIDRS